MTINLVVPNQNETTLRFLRKLRGKLLDKESIEVFEWQNNRFLKKIASIVDLKDGEKTFDEICIRFKKIIELASETRQELNIFSYKVGSRIIEEILAADLGFEKLKVKITHIMLEPHLKARGSWKIKKQSITALLLGVTAIGTLAARGRLSSVIGLVSAKMYNKLVKNNINEKMEDNLVNNIPYKIKRIALCTSKNKYLDELNQTFNLDLFIASKKVNILDFGIKGQNQLFYNYNKSQNKTKTKKKILKSFWLS
jgi:hypothetical protein